MNIWFLCLFSLVPFHHAGVHWVEVSVCPDYAEVLRFKNTLLEYELAHSAAEKDRLTEDPATSQLNAPPETPADTQANALPETPADTQADALPETPADTQVDALPETPADTQADALPKTPADTQTDALPETPADTQADALPETPADTQADALPETPADTQADALPQKLADTQSDALMPEIVPEPTQTPSVPEAEEYAEIPVPEPGRLPIPDPLPPTPSAPQPLAALPQVQFANAEEPLHQASAGNAPSAGTGQIPSNGQNVSDPGHSQNSVPEETSRTREEIPQPIRRPWGALTLSIFLLLLSLSANVFLGWQLLELRKAKIN